MNSILDDDKNDKENLQLAIKLLIRYGVKHEDPRLLLSAVLNALKHDIDMS